MNQDKYIIDRPIFIMGAARSGTTLLYNLLAGHPKLAWYSNITSRIRWVPQFAYFSRLYKYRQILQLPRLLTTFIPKPFEGSKLWDMCGPIDKKIVGNQILITNATDQETVRTRRLVSAHLKYHGKQRFINKSIRMSRRVGYLNSIFPDAIFIHIVRDPLGTVASLLSWTRWSKIKVVNDCYMTPHEWEKTGRDPTEMAALIWLQTNQRIINNSASLGNRFMRVFYEDLVENPKQALTSMVSHMQLDWDLEFEKFTESFHIRNMNYRYKERLSLEQIAIVEHIAQPLFGKLDNKYTTL